ncbi:MAG TPA: serine/threonine-protein kinase, partial [Polyangia bacterium]|nr:serine/threonine-protein kinase [Polyangia bacterium]
VGSYKVVRKLGEGGMGAVYEAVQEQIGRHVAIKVLLAGAAGNAQIAQRFFNEARATNLINHPSLVEIFDMGHLADGTAYIVMELLAGESLTDRIRKSPQGLGTSALRIARQTASALAAAHDKQIVHRDLKPDNVFIVPDPEATGGERAKVLDFGIAKMAADLQSGPLKTSTQMLMGTPAYMAPEQCRSSTNVDDKADVYSLGVMLYQMLSGRLPFDASDTMQLLYAHVHEPPPSLTSVVPDAPPALVEALAAMLLKDPKQRPSMAEVAATMARLGGTMTGTAEPATSQPTAPTIQTSSLASISQAVGQMTAATASHSGHTVALPGSTTTAAAGHVSKGSSHALWIVLGVLAFLAVGGVAAVVGVGYLAARAVKHGDADVKAAATNGTVAVGAAAVAGEPHCGRFAKILVPTPPGFNMMACSDTNGIGSLMFSGTGPTSAACAPMKTWAKGLGWDVDAEAAIAGTESLVLHRADAQLSLSCTATNGTTMVAVALTPKH